MAEVLISEIAQATILAAAEEPVRTRRAEFLWAFSPRKDHGSPTP